VLHLQCANGLKQSWNEHGNNKPTTSKHQQSLFGYLISFVVFVFKSASSKPVDDNPAVPTQWRAHFDRYSAQIATLENSLAAHEAEARRAAAHLAQVEAQRDAAQSNAQRAESRIVDATRIERELGGIHADLVGALLRVADAVDVVDESGDVAAMHWSNLTTDSSSTSVSPDAVAHRRHAASRAIDQLVARAVAAVTELRGSRDDARIAAKRTAGEFASLQQQCSDSNARVAALSEALREAQATAESLRRVADDSHEVVTAALERIDTHERSLASERANIARLERERDALRDRANAATEHAQQIEAQFAARSVQLERTSAEQAAAAAAAAAESARHGAIAALEGEFAQLRAAFDEKLERERQEFDARLHDKAREAEARATQLVVDLERRVHDADDAASTARLRNEAAWMQKQEQARATFEAELRRQRAELDADLAARAAASDAELATRRATLEREWEQQRAESAAEHERSMRDAQASLERERAAARAAELAANERVEQLTVAAEAAVNGERERLQREAEQWLAEQRQLLDATKSDVLARVEQVMRTQREKLELEAEELRRMSQQQIDEASDAARTALERARAAQADAKAAIGAARDDADMRVQQAQANAEQLVLNKERTANELVQRSASECDTRMAAAQRDADERVGAMRRVLDDLRAARSASEQETAELAAELARVRDASIDDERLYIRERDAMALKLAAAEAQVEAGKRVAAQVPVLERARSELIAEAARTAAANDRERKQLQTALSDAEARADKAVQETAAVRVALEQQVAHALEERRHAMVLLGRVPAQYLVAPSSSSSLDADDNDAQRGLPRTDELALQQERRKAHQSVVTHSDTLRRQLARNGELLKSWRTLGVATAEE
jgi:hypothetical protein